MVMLATANLSLMSLFAAAEEGLDAHYQGHRHSLPQATKGAMVRSP